MTVIVQEVVVDLIEVYLEVVALSGLVVKEEEL